MGNTISSGYTVNELNQFQFIKNFTEYQIDVYLDENPENIEKVFYYAFINNMQKIAEHIYEKYKNNIDIAKNVHYSICGKIISSKNLLEWIFDHCSSFYYFNIIREDKNFYKLIQGKNNISVSFYKRFNYEIIESIFEHPSWMINNDYEIFFKESDGCNWRKFAELKRKGIKIAYERYPSVVKKFKHPKTNETFLSLMMREYVMDTDFLINYIDSENIDEAYPILLDRNNIGVITGLIKKCCAIKPVHRNQIKSYEMEKLLRENNLLVI
jgi:hypothetical protein